MVDSGGVQPAAHETAGAPVHLVLGPLTGQPGGPQLTQRGVEGGGGGAAPVTV